MKMRYYLFLLCLLHTVNLVAQESQSTDKKQSAKGSFYFSYGYNKDWFSKSDIHFQNHSGELNKTTNHYDNYDFTVYNVKSKDRPGYNGILKNDISIPQYSYRIGYLFGPKKNTGIEINFDHTKYVAVDRQTARIKGEIFGEYMDKDTVLAGWFHFEHTNGANFMMLNFVKHAEIWKTASGKSGLKGVAKIGGGIVIPKTDVTLFGERLDNKFHVAGYITGVETGLHLFIGNYFFTEATVKGSFANYTNVLVIGSGKANHHFFAYETILTAGVQISL